MIDPTQTPSIDPKTLSAEGWRLQLYRYAQHASRGDWIAFAWLQHVANRVQEAVARGGGRIIINAPPRHGKTQLIGKWLPIWFLDWWPDKNVLFTSYGDSLASAYGRKVRDELVSNDRVWVKPNPKKTAANEWETKEGGGMITAGVGGPITGRGGDLMIVDDPHKNWEEATSPHHQQRVRDWFDGTFYSRQEPGATIIVVQTRWDPGDLTGYLMTDHHDDWDLIRLPAIAEEHDPLGRAEGAALCAERYNIAALDGLRAGVGPQKWAGLYQQRPRPLEGQIMKQDWIQHWSRLPTPEEAQWLQSWDFSFKDTGRSYVCGQVWARKEADKYLADQRRKKTDINGAIRMIKEVSAKYPHAYTKLIEDAANGPAIMQLLRGKMPGMVPVQAKGSKTARFVSVTPDCESHNVWLPPVDRFPWAAEFVERLLSFPSEPNDEGDTMSQALQRFMHPPLYMA